MRDCGREQRAAEIRELLRLDHNVNLVVLFDNPARARGSGIDLLLDCEDDDGLTIACLSWRLAATLDCPVRILLLDHLRRLPRLLVWIVAFGIPVKDWAGQWEQLVREQDEVLDPELVEEQELAVEVAARTKHRTDPGHVTLRCHDHDQLSSERPDDLAAEFVATLRGQAHIGYQPQHSGEIERDFRHWLRDPCGLDSTWGAKDWPVLRRALNDLLAVDARAFEVVASAAAR
jgi:hypothetical protein